MTVTSTATAATAAHVSSETFTSGDRTATLHTFRCYGCGSYLTAVHYGGAEYRPYDYCPYCKLRLVVAR